MDQHAPAIDERNSAGRPTRSKGPWERLRLAFGYIVAAACLIWVFHGIDLSTLIKHIGRVSYGWVGLAVACDIATYICQGWRWKLLLRPVGPISVLKTTEATYAGLFTSEVVPLRFGELVRAYLVSCWMPAEFAAVIPSIIVERLFDGIWLAVGVGFLLAFVPLSGTLHKAAIVLVAFIVLAAIGFAYAVFAKRSRLADESTGRSIHSKFLRTVVSFLVHLAQGLRGIGLSRYFYLALLLSLLMLFLQALAFWFIMIGYGFDFDFPVSALVFLIMRFGTAVPAAPANVGTYQAAVVAGLRLFGVTKTQAAGFSVVVFVLLTAPLWIIGFFAFLQSETTLLEIRKEIARLMEHHGRRH